jgi:hypothetical protein
MKPQYHHSLYCARESFDRDDRPNANGTQGAEIDARPPDEVSSGGRVEEEFKKIPRPINPARALSVRTPNMDPSYMHGSVSNSSQRARPRQHLVRSKKR